MDAALPHLSSLQTLGRRLHAQPRQVVVLRGLSARARGARGVSAHEDDALEFLERLAALSGGCPPTERLILQILPGDPGDAPDGGWRPRAWRPGDPLPASPQRTNGYVAISSFGRAPDGSWRRQKALFARLRCIMIDDVGTKVEEALAARVEPTWRVLTSPGNEQWIYVIRDGSTKRERADAVINGLVEQALLPRDERDPGMKGVTRVARVPGFINGKAKYGGDFRVSWTKRDGPLYALDDLIRGYGLELHERRQTIAVRVDGDAEVARALFTAYITVARKYGMIEQDIPNAAQWLRVRCPWESEHSDSRGGADLRFPAHENQYQGAFKCHHGHCEGRGWREYSDYLDELVAAEFELRHQRKRPKEKKP